MPRRSPSRSRSSRRAEAPRTSNREPRRSRSKWRGRGPILVGLAVVLAMAALGWLAARMPADLRSEAERAQHSGDREAALRAWTALNATDSATAATWLSQARAALAVGRAAGAEAALRLSIEKDPASAEGWRILLEIFRAEDRRIDAERFAWGAFDRVPTEARGAVLRELTLALLADVPDADARRTLARWVRTDPNDVDARVALIRRIAEQPADGDPDRDARLAELESIVETHPEHLGARAALATAMAEAGEPDRGRSALDAWPVNRRDDPRYLQLRGRWALEYDQQPEDAAVVLAEAVRAVPSDWRSWYRLARALRRIGRNGEARRAAESVARIREAIEPVPLGRRLADDLKNPDDPRSAADLADLADRAGFDRLAIAWRAEAQTRTHRARSARPGMREDRP